MELDAAGPAAVASAAYVHTVLMRNICYIFGNDLHIKLIWLYLVGDMQKGRQELKAAYTKLDRGL